MNAAIRAVVRTGIDAGYEMFGVANGYAGLTQGEIRPLGARDVAGIIQVGGTKLGSARAPEFHVESKQREAIAQLQSRGIDGLVVIGGNGSQTGAHALSKLGLPVVGVASTIDNDLYGSEVTIGVDTALNIALEAVDRLKVTASSHRRAFLVEVMGRNCGYLALMAAIAGGAEAVVIPEVETDLEALAHDLVSAHERGKKHAIVVVAEGAKLNAEELQRYLQEKTHPRGFELRSTLLGHVQRGGIPSAFDRTLATRLGAAAIRFLAEGKHGVLAGLRHSDTGPVAATPLEQVVSGKKPLDLELVRLAGVLAK